MKIISLIIVTTMLLSNYHLSTNCDKAEIINNTLDEFILLRKKENSKASRFNIYILNIYINDTSSHDICFSLGYIRNSYEYQYVNPQYYLIREGEYILVKIDENELGNDFKPLKLKPIRTISERISTFDLATIIQKLYPGDMGGITGITKAIRYCREGNNISKKNFENSDMLPLKQSIYDSFPADIQIEMIREGK